VNSRFEEITRGTVTAVLKVAQRPAYCQNGTHVGPSTMQACRGCPVMGAAMSGSYGRMLERARRVGAPCKPCWATHRVTAGGFIGPVWAREGLYPGVGVWSCLVQHGHSKVA
jgi:hypothetical protein